MLASTAPSFLKSSAAWGTRHFASSASLQIDSAFLPLNFCVQRIEQFSGAVEVHRAKGPSLKELVVQNENLAAAGLSFTAGARVWTR
jgi:hypothetical protein